MHLLFPFFGKGKNQRLPNRKQDTKEQRRPEVDYRKTVYQFITQHNDNGIDKK